MASFISVLDPMGFSPSIGFVATALATLELTTDLPPHFEIIPTIFITNRTLKNIPDQDLNPLAQSIVQKIEDLYKKVKEEQNVIFKDWLVHKAKELNIK